MSPQQAGTLIDRLVAAFDKTLKPDTAALYLEFLQAQPYERTRLAVDMCIEKERYFPSVGTIRRYADEVTFEGQPNSAAYLQDGDHTPWHRTPEGEYLLWRQMQIETKRFPVEAPGERDDLTDDEIADVRYWAYVYNTDGYRRRCEVGWERAWGSGATKAPADNVRYLSPVRG